MLIQDLVKKIRSSKTSAEEREIVNRECAKIRTSFKKDEAAMRPFNIIKLIYFHLLGYPTQFAQIECLKLVVSPNYSEKRIGYLALYILMDENQSVLMLVTNSLKNDLCNVNHYIVGLSLMAISNLASEQIVNDCASDVEKFFFSPNPYVRKKAALTAIKLTSKVPALVNQFLPYLNSYFQEVNHSVLLTGISLAIHMYKIDPSCISTLKTLVPFVVKNLMDLVKLLQFVRLVSVDIDAKLMGQIEMILAKMLSGTEYSTMMGHSVLYECIKTIVVMDGSSYLKTLSTLCLEKFFFRKEPNYEFVALNTLLLIAESNRSIVHKFRQQVLNCLKSEDSVISMAALNLVLYLADESDATDLTLELLKLLSCPSLIFKQQLVLILSQLLFRYASEQFHVEVMVKIILMLDKYISEDIIKAFLCLISNSTKIQPFAVRHLYQTLHEYSPPRFVLTLTAVWCIGEYSKHLLDLQLGSQPESLISVDSDHILSTLLNIFSSNEQIETYVITAIAKVLVSHHESLSSSLTTQALQYLQQYHQSPNFNLHQLSSLLSQILDKSEISSHILSTPLEPMHCSTYDKITREQKFPNDSGLPHRQAQETSFFSESYFSSPTDTTSLQNSSNNLVPLMSGLFINKDTDDNYNKESQPTDNNKLQSKKLFEDSLFGDDFGSINNNNYNSNNNYNNNNYNSNDNNLNNTNNNFNNSNNNYNLNNNNSNNNLNNTNNNLDNNNSNNNLNNSNNNYNNYNNYNTSNNNNNYNLNSINSNNNYATNTSNNNYATNTNNNTSNNNLNTNYNNVNSNSNTNNNNIHGNDLFNDFFGTVMSDNKNNNFATNTNNDNDHQVNSNVNLDDFFV